MTSSQVLPEHGRLRDLGSNATEVERALEINFALANRWGCILLIDEADVFLEARESEDFERNSLVAVFLRVLEYYAGNLILTTNRVGSFDEAFTSRIHISLYYPPLDKVSTVKIFEMNLDRIQERFEKKRGLTLDLDKSSIIEFAREYFQRSEEARWNGRQIRNACQTALALAEFDAQGEVLPDQPDNNEDSKKNIVVKLGAADFKKVEKAYLDFMQYLRDVHGTHASGRAHEAELRYDQYGVPMASNPLRSRLSNAFEPRYQQFSQYDYGAPQRPYYPSRTRYPPERMAPVRWTPRDYEEPEYGPGYRDDEWHQDPEYVYDRGPRQPPGQDRPRRRERPGPSYGGMPEDVGSEPRDERYGSSSRRAPQGDWGNLVGTKG